MTYDPAARGPHPVGARSIKLVDAARGGRVLWTELWYPADRRHAGEDLQRSTTDQYELLPGIPGLAAARQQAVRGAAPSDEPGPLVVFSHGFGSHRRQSSFLCTHLASHGYRVAAPDHLGNTIRDVAQLVLGASAAGRAPRLYESLPAVATARPLDLLAVARALRREPPPQVGALPEGAPVGLFGHSFGGWTALIAAGRDESVGASVALAPAGGRSTIPGAELARRIERDCRRSVPTVVVAAERDSLLPADGVRELAELLPDPKRLLLLERADHMHFCDYPQATHEMLRRQLAKPAAAPIARMLLSSELQPFAELCPEDEALAAVRAVTLAAFDAALRGDEQAASYLDQQLPPRLRAVPLGSSPTR